MGSGRQETRASSQEQAGAPPRGYAWQSPGRVQLKVQSAPGRPLAGVGASSGHSRR